MKNLEKLIQEYPIIDEEKADEVFEKYYTNEDNIDILVMMFDENSLQGKDTEKVSKIAIFLAENNNSYKMTGTKDGKISVSGWSDEQKETKNFKGGKHFVYFEV